MSVMLAHVSERVPVALHRRGTSQRQNRAAADQKPGDEPAVVSVRSQMLWVPAPCRNRRVIDGSPFAPLERRARGEHERVTRGAGPESARPNDRSLVAWEIGPAIVIPVHLRLAMPTGQERISPTVRELLRGEAHDVRPTERGLIEQQPANGFV